jgi:hypothetical protein
MPLLNAALIGKPNNAAERCQYQQCDDDQKRKARTLHVFIILSAAEDPDLVRGLVICWHLTTPNLDFTIYHPTVPES